MNKRNRTEQAVKEAVALRFDSDVDEVPIITAKGKGIIADKIIQKARENDIPLQDDPSLVQLLGQLNVNEAIPEELYEAVAEVFAFIYQLDKRIGRN